MKSLTNDDLFRFLDDDCPADLKEAFQKVIDEDPATKARLEQIQAMEQTASEIGLEPTSPGFTDQIVASCPMGRIGEPEDMAGVALFLASRAGAYVTGAVIPVDGGITTTR